MQVNLLQEYYGNLIFDNTVGFFLGYELGSPLDSPIDFETGPPVGLQFTVKNPPYSKVR